MSDDKHPEKEMEMLTKAIVDAITRSQEVRDAIRNLTKSDEACSKSFMVLMLKVSNLAESLGVDFPGCKSHEGGPCSTSAADFMETLTGGKLKNNKPVIRKNTEDGKPLTRGEAAFRDYLANNFDEEAWLKRHGLIL